MIKFPEWISREKCQIVRFIPCYDCKELISRIRTRLLKVWRVVAKKWSVRSAIKRYNSRPCSNDTVIVETALLSCCYRLRESQGNSIARTSTYPTWALFTFPGFQGEHFALSSRLSDRAPVLLLTENRHFEERRCYTLRPLIFRIVSTRTIYAKANIYKEQINNVIIQRDLTGSFGLILFKSY